jgi:hypothetical protein
MIAAHASVSMVLPVARLEMFWKGLPLGYAYA